MNKQEIITKCKEYLKLDEKLYGFWKKGMPYWEEGKGLTKRGWKKHMQIEREQDKLLEEIGMRRVIGEIDLTYSPINDLIKILNKVEV